MADKKISQLTALSAANVASATDVLAIVDTSATETKKITAKDLIDGALNGGTANGVLYLNGSKVATSGSALTFSGTTLVNTGPLKVGDGAASNTSRLMVNNATNTATGIQLFQDGIESWIMGMPANSAGLAWSASGAEQMRLTSAGLGIGTASPAYRIDALLGAGSGNIARFGQSGVSNGYTITTSGTALTHEWATAGSVSMKIDANANIVAGTSAALATTATNGFLYVPTCAGTPTGTPTAITGMVPIVVNTTNNKLYFYSGGAWRDAGP